MQSYTFFFLYFAIEIVKSSQNKLLTLQRNIILQSVFKNFILNQIDKIEALN